ncbi:MAG: CDP-alcohol phosphatidyltransferase family protein [Acidobacteriia bacterium]|nr:CDP-alcohol phosphatidyltransferase family protein [Terriglobia bacterium]
MAPRALTPANQITILRLVFVPVFAILVVGGHYRLALAVLVAAALSDVVDGTVARLLKQESPLGMALDPIADKILMTTGYLILAFRGVFPWWLTILVLSRDVAIIMTALLICLVAGYRPFPPSIPGKVSTVTQVATLFVAVAHAARVPLVTGQVLEIFVYLAGALTLISGIHYLAIVHRYAHHTSSAVASEPGVAESPGPLEPTEEVESSREAPSPRHS